MMGCVFSFPDFARFWRQGLFKSSLMLIQYLLGKQFCGIFFLYIFVGFAASKLWESVDPHGFCGPVAWHDKSLPGEASENVKFKLGLDLGPKR